MCLILLVNTHDWQICIFQSVKRIRKGMDIPFQLKYTENDIYENCRKRFESFSLNKAIYMSFKYTSVLSNKAFYNLQL